MQTVLKRSLKSFTFIYMLTACEIIIDTIDIIEIILQKPK